MSFPNSHESDPESIQGTISEAHRSLDAIRRWFGSASRITMLLALLAVFVAMVALFESYQRQTKKLRLISTSRLRAMRRC